MNHRNGALVEGHLITPTLFAFRLLPFPQIWCHTRKANEVLLYITMDRTEHEEMERMGWCLLD